MTTKSQTTASDVQALIKARNGVLWIDGREEQRIEGWLFKAAEGAGYMPFLWDCVQGAIDVAGNPVPGMAGQPGPFDQPGAIVPADASTILRLIDQRSRQGQAELWILRDLHKWVEGPGGNQILRALRNRRPTRRGSSRSHNRNRSSWSCLDDGFRSSRLIGEDFFHSLQDALASKFGKADLRGRRVKNSGEE